MMRSALFLLWLSAAMCSAGVIGLAQESDGASAKRLTLRDILLEHGDRLDCYFTFERLTLAEDRLRALDAIGDFAATKLDNVEELADFLRKSLVDVDVDLVVQKSRQPVIHLKDARLVDAAQYPLDQKVTVSHEGSLAGLGQSIHQHLPTVNTFYFGAIGSDFNDHVTKVKLYQAKGIVRELITDAVPLKGYSRILWRASTIRTPEGNWDSQIQYYGPLKKSEK